MDIGVNTTVKNQTVSVSGFTLRS